MSAATPLIEIEIPASRIMRERDEAKAECARLTVELERLRNQSNRDHEQRLRADRRANAYEAAYETLVEMLPTIGEKCRECDGTGEVYGSVDCFSDAIGHYERRSTVADECDNCFGGWLPKGAQP